MKEEKTLSESLGELCIAVFLMIHGILAWSLVGLLSYDWFIKPLNLIYTPSFTYANFVGITMFLAVIFHSSWIHLIKDEYKVSKSTQNGYSIINPWLFLLVSYIGHLFL